MPSELYNIIEGVSREKGIDPQIVVSAVEDAIVMATRKHYKSQENFRAKLDKDSGKINAYVVKTVVDTPEQVEDPNLQITVEDARRVDPSLEVGGELLTPKPIDGILGRIAAQLAKQVIFQKVREAERDTVYNEYIGRVGEIVNATVKRVEGPDVIFDIGKAEARMPRKEQSRLESFAVGERVRVVIARVERASKGPGVVVSRAAPELGTAPVPDRSSGNLRWHGRHPRDRARGRRAHENRRHVEGQRRGRRRRLRRHEGHARAVDHPRIARREDRHHRIPRRCGHVR